jgi:hypothetical protein
MKAIFRDGDALVIWYKRVERGTWQLPDNWAKNNPQHVLVHRIEESRRAANRRRDQRESRRRLAITPAGTATAASPPDPSNTGPPKSDAAKPDATSRGRSVIRPPCAVQTAPSSGAAARSVRSSCERIAIVS